MSSEEGGAQGGKKRRTAPDAQGAAEPAKHTHEATLAQEWPFETDFNDHFETPKRAYRDVKPVLRVVARRCGVDTANVRVYDPYFCRGSMVRHLNELGFQSVINLKRDFYKDIDSDSVPAHDVLLTNPPYSGEHKAFLFAWLLEQHRVFVLDPASTRSRPFMLLLPAWTAKWLPWRTFLWAMSRLRKGKTDVTMEDARQRTKKLANLSSDQLEYKAGVFYYAPAHKYEYTAAVASRETAPFFGIWFCGGFSDDDQRLAAIAALDKRAARARSKAHDDDHDASTPQDAARAAAEHGDVVPAGCGKVLTTLRALVEAGHLVSVEEERKQALTDPEVRTRRDQAIAKLEQERKQRPRKRDYQDRPISSYTPKTVGEEGRKELEEALEMPQNAAACRHYFVGKGCVRGDKCKFKHELKD